MKVMPRIVGIFAIVGGVIMMIAGVVTYFEVQEQLKDEKIVVSDDAENFAGEPVDGPLTAYAEAEVIKKHALEASGGKTYAELDQDDPTRATVQSARRSCEPPCSRRSSPSVSPSSSSASASCSSSWASPCWRSTARSSASQPPDRPLQQPRRTR